MRFDGDNYMPEGEARDTSDAAFDRASDEVNFDVAADAITADDNGGKGDIDDDPFARSDSEAEPRAIDVAAVGSLALRETQQPPGEPTLDKIRRLYREGKIPTYGAVAGEKRLVNTYGDAYLRGKEAIDSWRAQQPPDDKLADSVAKKFTTAWIKSLAVEDDPEPIGADVVPAALTRYHETARHIQETHGIKTDTVSIALFNSRDEIDQAFAEGNEAGMVPANIRYAIDNAKMNSLEGVRQSVGNIHAVKSAIDEGRLEASDYLTKRIINHFAVRTGDSEACVARAGKYVTDIADMSTIYQGNKYVTQARIQEICMRSNDPETVIAEKLRLVDSLSRYEGQGAVDRLGRGAITADEVAFAVFSQRDPQAKLDAYLRDAPGIRAAIEDRLTPDAVKRLYFENANPLKSAQKEVAEIDAVKQALAGHPHADALQDSDYVYLVKYHSKNAVEMGGEMATNLAITREVFADNQRVNEKMLHRASVMGGDAVDSVNYMLTKARTLQSAHIREGIPTQVYDEAVVSDDPDQYVGDFIEVRNRALEQFGGRVPRSVINQICANSADPMDRISRGLRAIDDVRAAYGSFADIDEERLVRDALETGNVRAAAVDSYASAVFEEMQDYSRERPKAGSRAHMHFTLRPRTEMVREMFDEWTKDILHGDASMGAADRFGRLYYSYTYRPDAQDLTRQPELLRAIAEHYANYIQRLDDEGFNNPAAVAFINNERRLITRMGRSAETKQQVLEAARYYPGDVLDAQSKYSVNLRLLRRHVHGQKVPEPLLKHFARYRKSADSAVEALDRQLEKTRALPQQFAGVEGVDGRVIYYYQAHYYEDPAQGVRDFLRRRESVKTMVGGDNDFDDHIVRDLCLQVVSPHKFPGAIAEYKERLNTIREQVYVMGKNVDDDLLREAASMKTHNVQSRVDRALARQRTRDRRTARSVRRSRRG